jgi:hypothetical protein
MLLPQSPFISRSHFLSTIDPSMVHFQSPKS